MPETVPRPHVPARGVHVIPGDVPEGVVPPSTSLTPPTTPHPIPDATHPYVHLGYGPWVASGHQCGDVKPGGCGEPIYERRVTARWNGVGEERFIGWDLAGCPSCAPRPDVPDEPQDVVTALVDKARELGVRIGGYEATVLAARVVAVARPEIERQVREQITREAEAARRG